MSGTFDRQRAVFDFRKFISVHRAWQGRHVNFAAARMRSSEHEDVSKGDALGVFLKLHPEHTDHEAAIDMDFGGQECFTFSKERWEETTTNPAVTKPK
jgi:hypothetical protein